MRGSVGVVLALCVLSAGCPPPEGPCTVPGDCTPDQACVDGQCHNRLGFSIPALGTGGGQPPSSSSPAVSPSSSSSGGSSSSSIDVCTAGDLTCTDAACTQTATGATLCTGPVRTGISSDSVHPGDQVRVNVRLENNGSASVSIFALTLELKNQSLVTRGTGERCPGVGIPITLAASGDSVCVPFKVSVAANAPEETVYGTVGGVVGTGGAFHFSSPMFSWTIVEP